MSEKTDYEEKILKKVELLEKTLGRILKEVVQRVLTLEKNVKDLNDFAIGISVRLGIKKEK